jgi:hypothetical protein
MNTRRRVTEKLAFADSMIRGRRLRERGTGRTAIRGNRILPFVGFADRRPLGKRNRDGLLVSAEFRGQTAYQVDDNSPATICEFHVHPIRTGFWCHTKLLRRIRFEKLEQALSKRRSFRVPMKPTLAPNAARARPRPNYRPFLEGDLFTFDQPCGVQPRDDRRRS